MSDRPERGLLDTSVVVELRALPWEALPVEGAVSAVTLAELAAGPHAATDPAERARRQSVLQSIEARLEVLPFDERAARSFGLVYAAVSNTGRQARGPRFVDLLIAATAVAHDLPLYTRNATDVRGLDDLLDVRVV